MKRLVNGKAVEVLDDEADSPLRDRSGDMDMTEASADDLMQTCENCKWWDTSTQMANTQPDTTGACRVMPPRINKMTGGAMWPFTDQSDWCGSFVVDRSSGKEV